MSRRIDIELTSARDDGTWTWRAAGAPPPQGVLDGAGLYPGARAGDGGRAQGGVGVGGITILSGGPPREQRSDEARLEVVGPPRDAAPVTSSLVSRRERPDRDGERRGPPRGDDRPGDRPRRPPRERSERPARDGADRPSRDRGERGD